MAKVKPRVKVPKSASSGEIIEIKALIAHPMHTGLAKDKEGNKIPRRIINTFKVLFNGEQVFSVDMQPSVSANPYISFPYKASESGSFQFVWVEDGGKEFTLSKEMAVS